MYYRKSAECHHPLNCFMKDQIISNLDNPGQLEKLYRADRSSFKRAFRNLYPELKESSIARFWYERLNFNSEEIYLNSSRDLLFVIFASVIAGLIARMPAFTGMSEEFFYPR